MKRKLINSCSNTLLVAGQEVTSLGSDVASGALLHKFSPSYGNYGSSK